MMKFIVILICCTLLVVAGVIERHNLNRNVAKIPLRINVNGIRGKSTGTRFITAVLEAAGYQVVGKTTGTSARMIKWGQKEEIEIKRPIIGQNIGEQVSVIKKAANMGANALVCECMAVNPDYQVVYQHQMIQANILVICNVEEDHLDEMGPTTDQIADAFADTIPYNGTLVITKSEYSEYFKKRAKKRHTRTICIDPEIVPDEYIAKFPYLVFKNNCAVAIGVAVALNIDLSLAMEAMLDAHPEPGRTQTKKVDYDDEHSCWLVNAFAANEPTATSEILDLTLQETTDYKKLMIMLCCRDDRIDRTRQFITDFLPDLKADYLVVIGTGTIEVADAFNKNAFKGIGEYIDLTGYNGHEIIEALKPIADESLIFCAGNIHGAADEFLDEFADIQI